MRKGRTGVAAVLAQGHHVGVVRHAATNNAQFRGREDLNGQSVGNERGVQTGRIVARRCGARGKGGVARARLAQATPDVQVAALEVCVGVVAASLVVVLEGGKPRAGAHGVHLARKANVVVDGRHGAPAQHRAAVRAPNHREACDAALGKPVARLDVLRHRVADARDGPLARELGTAHELRVHVAAAKDVHGVHRATQPLVVANVGVLARAQAGKLARSPDLEVGAVGAHGCKLAQVGQGVGVIGRRHELRGKGCQEALSHGRERAGVAGDLAREGRLAVEVGAARDVELGVAARLGERCPHDLGDLGAGHLGVLATTGEQGAEAALPALAPELAAAVGGEDELLGAGVCQGVGRCARARLEVIERGARGKADHVDEALARVAGRLVAIGQNRARRRLAQRELAGGGVVVDNVGVVVGLAPVDVDVGGVAQQHAAGHDGALGGAAGEGNLERLVRGKAVVGPLQPRERAGGQARAMPHHRNLEQHKRAHIGVLRAQPAPLGSLRLHHDSVSPIIYQRGQRDGSFVPAKRGH